MKVIFIESCKIALCRFLLENVADDDICAWSKPGIGEYDR